MPGRWSEPGKGEAPRHGKEGEPRAAPRQPGRENNPAAADEGRTSGRRGLWPAEILLLLMALPTEVPVLAAAGFPTGYSSYDHK